jgi:hypothetical protein
MILVKDNFFTDPEKIRSISILSKYREPYSFRFSTTSEKHIHYCDGWRGFRSKIENYSDSSNLNELQKILTTTINYYNLNKNSKIDLYFHYFIEKTKETCFPSFEEYKYHKDDHEYKYAGVVYLSKKPPKNSGTIIINETTNEKIIVENVYNRLVCYPSNFLHAPMDLFGSNIHNGRLTVTFFVS